MIAIGVICIVLGILLGIGWLLTVGVILAVIGAILLVLNRVGRGPLLY